MVQCGVVDEVGLAGAATYEAMTAAGVYEGIICRIHPDSVYRACNVTRLGKISLIMNSSSS